VFALAGCATMAGRPVAKIAEPGIEGAYLPLKGRIHLGIDRAAGAAMVIAPGIAVTNAHNANLLDPKSVIGQARDYDLLFFRVLQNSPAPTAAPVKGEAVSAYGQDTDENLRIAHGVVLQIVTCPGCDAPAYFTFAGDAGPGFSGGPVVDGAGNLIGITFGYKDQGPERLIFAYDMGRVRAELSVVQKRGPGKKIIQ
jgi:S1-C subfamily serine protease